MALGIDKCYINEMRVIKIIKGIILMEFFPKRIIVKMGDLYENSYFDLLSV
jgi:hypothetical protein